MPIVLQPGVLIRSDEATIVYLVHEDAALRGPLRFVVQQLSPTAVFVKRKALRLVRAILAARLRETVFEEEEEEGEGEGAAGGAGAARGAAGEEE
jgi:hypothetical protein